MSPPTSLIIPSLSMASVSSAPSEVLPRAVIRRARSLILSLTLGGLALGGLIACDDGPDPLPKLDIEAPVLPRDAAMITRGPLGDGPGHWTREIRAVAIDEQDYIVLSSAKERIEGAFSTLVINVPLVDKRTREECLSGTRGLDALPERTVPRILERIAEKDLTFERVVVQVDLFKPQRDDFHRLCLEESGASKPSFYVPEIREDLLSAFGGLARVSGIDAIVVGVELNLYPELSSMSAYNRAWDYTNLTSLYREIYARIKEQNDEVQVGPSVSWPSLKLDAVPSIAAEFGLERDELLTLELALRRTVWPLLWDGERASADFIGVALFARTTEAPYLGNAAPEDIDAVLDFYRELPLLAAHPEFETPLPLALTSVDWSTENNASGGSKTEYLISLKQALSATSFEWVAWRRLANIPQDPPETSPCRSVSNLGYGVDFCFAGLLDLNGQPRSVWDEFVRDPE